MGDRGLIYIDDTKDYIYTHWLGTKMPELLQNVLKQNSDLWHKPESLAMLIYDEFYKANGNSETSISMGKLYVETRKYIHVSCKEELISILTGTKCTCSYTFRAYVKQHIHEDFINGQLVFDTERTKESKIRIEYKPDGELIIFETNPKPKPKPNPKQKQRKRAKFVYLRPVTRAITETIDAQLS